MADDPVIIYPKWEIPLMAALAETDPDKLLEQVKEAEKAVSKRFGQIHGVPPTQQKLRRSERWRILWMFSGERRVSRRHPEQEGYDTVMTH